MTQDLTPMRAQIRAELAGIVPLDELEQQHRREALAWVDSGAELCRLAKPATPPVHLVSYFAVLEGQRMLLVDHKNAGLWLPPGGHVEPGEHPRSTVARELQEELGVSAPHAIGAPLLLTRSTTVGLTAGHEDVSLWYLVQLPSGTPLQFDADEFHGLGWFGLDELPLARSDPHLGRFVRKLQAAASMQA